MDYQRTFAISAAGMQVERSRVEVAAMNLANANTVQSPTGPSFMPLRVIAAPATDFAAQVTDGLELPSLPMATLEATGAKPRLVQDPGHPLADALGFVAYPGVDAATEMVTLLSATRAYEANVAAMNTARALALKTLEIGRGG